MKKHLKALLVGAAVAGSILACTAAYARFSDSVTVTNHISVGDINISLRELEKKDGREMKYQDRRIVLPGDEISKIPRITNHSEQLFFLIFRRQPLMDRRGSWQRGCRIWKNISRSLFFRRFPRI